MGVLARLAVAMVVLGTRQAGIAAARARGRKGGRHRLRLSDPKLVLAKKLHGDTTQAIEEICQTLRISRSTYHRYVARAAEGENP